MNKTPTQELIDSLIDRYGIAHITELAERVKMHQPTLLRIYNGQVPKFKTVKPLLDYFGLSYDQFLAGGPVGVGHYVAEPKPHYDRDTERLLRVWGNLRPAAKKHLISLMQEIASSAELTAAGTHAGKKPYLKESSDGRDHNFGAAERAGKKKAG